MDNPTVLYRKSTKALVNGVDICKGVKYTAVSHTWSMWDNMSKDILCIEQDSRCKGTTNFNDMVDFVKTEWLWIDTLCISENNKVTKISNMRKYYRDAEMVLVVLDTSNGDYNLRALENASSYWMAIGEQFRLTSQEIAREWLQCGEAAVYYTLCRMFKAEWFKKGWTLQEMLLAKDILLWNSSTSVTIPNAWKRIDWLGLIDPHFMKSLQIDEDYSMLQRIFQVKANNMLVESRFEIESLDYLMQGRRCTKDEDYVYCILGLLEVDIKIEYGIPLSVCKRRLFSRLFEEQRAASLFTHTGSGVFPIQNEYGSLSMDNPRVDRAVYSLSHKGVKFASCGVYIYDIIRVFRTNSIDKRYPNQNLWAITRNLGDNPSGYKKLVKALLCTTGTNDNDFINTKSEWFLKIAKGLVPTPNEELPTDYICILLHSLLNQPQTPLVSYGMVHNNISICGYVFTCLETVPEDGKCLLLAPGLLGERCEIEILCSGLNLHTIKQQKIGVTLNLRRGCLDTIEPVANLLDVIVVNNKFRRHSK